MNTFWAFYGDGNRVAILAVVYLRGNAKTAIVLGRVNSNTLGTASMNIDVAKSIAYDDGWMRANRKTVRRSDRPL